MMPSTARGARCLIESLLFVVQGLIKCGFNSLQSLESLEREKRQRVKRTTSLFKHKQSPNESLAQNKSKSKSKLKLQVKSKPEAEAEGETETKTRAKLHIEYTSNQSSILVKLKPLLQTKMSCYSFKWDSEKKLEEGDSRRHRIAANPVKAQFYFYSANIEYAYVFLEYFFEWLVDSILAIFVLFFLAIPSGVAKGSLKVLSRAMEDIFFPLINIFLDPVVFVLGSIAAAFRGNVSISVSKTEGGFSSEVKMGADQV